MELRYDLPAREPEEDMVAEWAFGFSEVDSSFEDLMTLADDFYSDAENLMGPERLGYNLGLAFGKACEDFSLEEDDLRTVRYALGSSAGRRGDGRVKVVDLFEYGVDDFPELREEYGL